MITFTSKYKKNEGLVMSPFELLELYLYGIPIQNKLGTTMNNDTIKTYIQSAQEQIEHYLDIKLPRQVVEEDITYYLKDFVNWSFIPTSYPVVTPLQLWGYFGTVKQIQYPLEWLSSRKTSDGKTYYRQMFMVPTGALVSGSAELIATGILPSLHFMGQKFIPNYWSVRYCTGYMTVPRDILTVIGKIASIYILAQLGDIVLGGGIGNMSLSIDGLSQSLGKEAAGYSNRIKQYGEDLKTELPHLLDYYKGLELMSM